MRQSRRRWSSAHGRFILRPGGASAFQTCRPGDGCLTLIREVRTGKRSSTGFRRFPRLLNKSALERRICRGLDSSSVPAAAKSEAESGEEKRSPTSRRVGHGAHRRWMCRLGTRWGVSCACSSRTLASRMNCMMVRVSSPTSRRCSTCRRRNSISVRSTGSGPAGLGGGTGDRGADLEIAGRRC